jgi:hypothetical protein
MEMLVEEEISKKTDKAKEAFEQKWGDLRLSFDRG